MREILFRGKLKSNGGWVTGNLVKTMHETFINDIKFIPAKSIPSYHFAEVDPETIGQYTGLKDKNGKMIFEGDKYYDQKLMRHPGRKHSGTYWINVECEIAFIKGMFDGKVITEKVHYCELVFFPSGTMGGLPKEIEITGTIHDKQGE